MDINTVDFVMGTLVALALHILAEVVFICDLHKGWIRKGKTIEFFPAWKDTKKPFYWFLGWSTAKCIVDAIIFLVYLIVVTSIGKFALMALALGVWFISLFFQMIIYAISETIAVSIVRRKAPQPKSEASETDVIADKALENEEAE